MKSYGILIAPGCSQGKTTLILYYFNTRYLIFICVKKFSLLKIMKIHAA